jgi:hypothetical protein
MWKRRRVWRVKFPMQMPMHYRQIRTLSDNLGWIISLEGHLDLESCFLACAGIFSVKRHADENEHDY